VVEGVAQINMSEIFAAGRNAESLDARLSQLVYTVDSLRGVRSVRVFVEGGVPLGLFPGHSLAVPVTIKSLAPDVPVPQPGPDAGPVSAETRALQQRLADLGFLAPSGVDGKAGEQTRFGVIAFQKWGRLGRDGVAGPATQAALAQAQRPTPITSGAGRRIEVLLDRQLALLIEGGAVARAVHGSTGAGGTPTPAGSYSIFRKERRSWSYPFQVWLPWASYFVGGIAFHEYPDVPVTPASHGCVRVPRYDAQFLYGFAPIGTPVRVLARS
jgi:lipoprotein-anchoring transpeptidase ErfK/SrfK